MLQLHLVQLLRLVVLQNLEMRVFVVSTPVGLEDGLIDPVFEISCSRCGDLRPSSYCTCRLLQDLGDQANPAALITFWLEIGCREAFTSIDLHDVPGDLEGLLRGQENDGVCDFGNVRYPWLQLVRLITVPQRYFPLLLVLEFGILGFGHAHVQVHVGVDDGRGDAIHADSERCQLNGRGFGQGLYASLADRVPKVALLGLAAPGARDVDYASVVLLQVLVQDHGHVECASQIDVDQVVEILGKRVLQIAIEESTGRIDQNV